MINFTIDIIWLTIYSTLHYTNGAVTACITCSHVGSNRRDTLAIIIQYLHMSHT